MYHTTSEESELQSMRKDHESMIMEATAWEEALAYWYWQEEEERKNEEEEEEEEEEED